MICPSLIFVTRADRDNIDVPSGNNYFSERGMDHGRTDFAEQKFIEILETFTDSQNNDGTREIIVLSIAWTQITTQD